MIICLEFAWHDWWTHGLIELRTKQEQGNIYSFVYRKCFIVICSHEHVNVLQIIIKDIEIKKFKSAFQNKLNWFRLVRKEGHRTWQRAFSTVDSLIRNLLLFICYTFEIDSCEFLGCCKTTRVTIIQLSLLSTAEMHQKQTFMYKSSARENLTSSHATILQ